MKQVERTVDEYMALSGMILKVKPGAEGSVRAWLESMPGVSVEEKTPQGDFILVAEAGSISALHELCQEIEGNEGVLGLYPSYITVEDEEKHCGKVQRVHREIWAGLCGLLRFRPDLCRGNLHHAENLPGGHRHQQCGGHAEYPFFLTTGRMLEHWHTATMTGNVPELKNAAPEMYVEVNEEDAKRLGIGEGDLVNITSRRATCKFKAKINGRGKPMPGLVYVSFHDKEDDRLINKVLLDAFDPGSKQPEYKVCAVQVSKA